MKREDKKGTMPILNYSRVSLAGRFNIKKGVKPESLEKTGVWERIKMPSSLYEEYKRFYYPSLLRSMIEIDDEEEQSICRYALKLPETTENLMILNVDGENAPAINYPCKINSIRLWFFKYEMVLFSIEIEDCPDSFSELTLMHSKWKDWNNQYESFRTKALDDILKPLVSLTGMINPAYITYSGTKLRQFQLIETDSIDDELLYEVGSFSPIGVIANDNPQAKYKPSDDYFQRIKKENTISAFSNWKALALNDSFTIIAIDTFFRENEFEENFELLYMRCLLEEFYCFDRNNQYHEDKYIDSDKMEREIAYMEKHYFFDDMSYNFLPPLMYRTMVKGLGISENRNQLIEHVKKSLRDARHDRDSRAVNFVQIFAGISVVWTLREMLIAISPCIDKGFSALVAAVISVAMTILLLKRPIISKKRIYKIPKFLIRFFKVTQISKNIKVFSSSNDSSVSIFLSKEVKKHLQRHFNSAMPGSKFIGDSPEQLLQVIVDNYPRIIRNTSINENKCKVVSITFPYDIGSCNVVSINDLTADELLTLKEVQRDATLVRCVSCARIIPTRECQLILDEKNNIITAYPGEMAPPLPDSPDIHDEYWDNHVFIEPVEPNK